MAQARPHFLRAQTRLEPVILRMKKNALIALLAVYLCPATAPAESFYSHHVFFDNSAVDACYESSGMIIKPSELDLIGPKLPLDGTHAFSPPNSLRLKWKSGTGGDWRIKLQAQPHYGRNRIFEGNALSFWCYSERPISAEDSPLISLQDKKDFGCPPTALFPDGLPAGKWVRVIIPFKNFKPLYGQTEENTFDPSKIDRLWLFQGLDDGKDHTVYLDSITICDAASTDEHLSAPKGLTVEAAEKHCDLNWQRNTKEKIISYKIYRSSDGTNFISVGTQRSDFCRAVDWVEATNQTFYYRISAVDLAGHESRPSAIVGATTHALNDEELLDMVQRGSFRYYWEAAHPHAGMAIEIRPGDENLVAVGGSGFGIMALIVGAERHFVSRSECAERILKITRFLKKAERFHGAWPHFLDGDTGKAINYFGKYDNGGDLVETSFLLEGLLAARGYFDGENSAEKEIRENISSLWNGVEWDWYRKDKDSDLLYWHWSPDHAWQISHPLIGWNETHITYLLAIAAPRHGVPASLYHSGWASQSKFAVKYRHNWARTRLGDHYTNGNSFYGIKLDVGEGNGSDLFFVPFSQMGFDPRGKRDRYANYFENSRSIALINRAYCIDNPLKHAGYGPECWGISAGINAGGGRPLPKDDNGTICISASLGAFPFTPKESMAALKHFYRDLGKQTWGIYGFIDGFNQSENWFEPVWMGLNQAPIAVMIENYRSGLIWKQFMKNPEIQGAITRIGFKPDERDSGSK